MLPRADIPEVLRGLGARLHPGGLLALGMVAGDLDAVEIPFLGVPVAVSAYPSDALNGVIAAAGFTVETADEMNVAAEGWAGRDAAVHARPPEVAVHTVRKQLSIDEYRLVVGITLLPMGGVSLLLSVVVAEGGWR